MQFDFSGMNDKEVVELYQQAQSEALRRLQEHKAEAWGKVKEVIHDYIDKYGAISVELCGDDLEYIIGIGDNLSEPGIIQILD